jgi:hypothetical protein
MSKIGNYVVGLEELTAAVMALEPFGEYFCVDEEVYGCDHCEAISSPIPVKHSISCPVTKLREVLTKQGSK